MATTGVNGFGRSGRLVVLWAALAAAQAPRFLAAHDGQAPEAVGATGPGAGEGAEAAGDPNGRTGPIRVLEVASEEDGNG